MKPVYFLNIYIQYLLWIKDIKNCKKGFGNNDINIENIYSWKFVFLIPL